MKQKASQAAPHLAHWPNRVPKEIPPVQTTLWENLEISARRYPDKTALVFFGLQISYRTLTEQAERLCGWLQHNAGVKPGDRVVLMAQNSPQYIIGYYAVLRAGAVVVPVNPMVKAAELPHYFTDAQAKVALCTADVAAQIFEAVAMLPADDSVNAVVVSEYSDMMPAEPTPTPPPHWFDWLYARCELPAVATSWSEVMAPAQSALPYQADPDDLAMLGYTSGTTGRPKGCMHSHRTLSHTIASGALWNNSSAADVNFAVVPMFHITGVQFAMHTPLYLGATSVILPRWDREIAGRLISDYRVTTWTNIPTMVIDLLASPNMASFDLSSIEVIGGGGAAMPEAVARKLMDQYGLPYQEGYGLTETAAPSHGNPPGNAKRQCLGIPYVGTDSRIVDPETLQEVDWGEIGEIVMHGPQIFLGYWGNELATKEAFFELDGKTFFRSGDLGRVDEDGYFFITDRLKRMINASGFKVWPAEVESMLFDHPDIQEVCIISTRDSYRGETVKAVVVPRAGARGSLTAEQIEQWAREKMAAYKVPRVVEFVDALPKSGSGKVMWRYLQEQENEKTGPDQYPAK